MWPTALRSQASARQQNMPLARWPDAGDLSRSGPRVGRHSANPLVPGLGNELRRRYEHFTLAADQHAAASPRPPYLQSLSLVAHAQP
jgi:hypothetical protein